MSEKKFSWIAGIFYVFIALALIGGFIFFNSMQLANLFNGTGQGRAGPITIEVTIEDGLIKGAEVLTFPEGERIPESADVIFSQAIENGNAFNIDTVSGATMTSNALITALKQASTEAGIMGEDTYTASSDGFYGPIMVEATIFDGAIVGIHVHEAIEGEFLPQSADTIFTQAITHGNADNLDIVSGATSTSTALISALQEISNTAGIAGKTFIGYGEGYQGPLSIQITVENDVIVKARLLNLSDSEFSVPSAKAVLEQAVQVGNADNLDIIAGATSTSTGVITALQDAMANR